MDFSTISNADSLPTETVNVIGGPCLQLLQKLRTKKAEIHVFQDFLPFQIYRISWM